ncbi:hypothetical protein MSG28_000728 [Choristoneura fumiferana]|uniref:Uncharacterized protein n=1 Tax=Choristoneura fumiferana TaxID=7141 RepID=A0ACC0K2I0_CHOFU|nr:hypothetical protein MSG28_000728 [Choristoneura fumiferana]
MKPPKKDFVHTCGPRWRELVTRGALGALSAGGAAVSAGWAGAGACGALAAAARALRRPQPVACAALSARAAAAARLATALHWRRALLPPATEECAAALREVARALTAAGLVARRSAISLEELAWRPHVSGTDGVSNRVLKLLSETSIRLLVTTFNAGLSKSHFPSVWKTAEMIKQPQTLSTSINALLALADDPDPKLQINWKRLYRLSPSTPSTVRQGDAVTVETSSIN